MLVSSGDRLAPTEATAETRRMVVEGFCRKLCSSFETPQSQLRCASFLRFAPVGDGRVPLAHITPFRGERVPVGRWCEPTEPTGEKAKGVC